MDEPRYNIRAVERMTGVPAPTLRSWERRYGFPAPSRTASARRLYSDREVNAVRWVRAQTLGGLSVAQAVHLAQSGTTAGPNLSTISHPAGPNGAPAPSPDGWSPVAAAPRPAMPSAGGVAAGEAAAPGRLVAGIVDAVSAYDEPALEGTLSAAFARHAADAVVVDVISPALTEIGGRWARGELSVSAEHFASNMIQRRLFALLGQQPAVAHAPLAVLACVSGEQHEIGLLMLALFLRWAGARVLYLGADVPAEDLLRCLRETEAGAVCLSAVDPSSRRALAETVARLRQAGVRLPIFAGGAAARLDPPPGAEAPPAGLHAAAEQVMAALRAR